MTDLDAKKRQALQKIANYVEKKCISDITAHDWWHTYRVYQMSLKLSRAEKTDWFIAGIIALLHDVYDWKVVPDGFDTQIEIKKLLVKFRLEDLLSEEDIENISYSVTNLGYKGGFSSIKLSPEGQIAQDADKLDAIGAIAIARTFSYGGKHNRPIYDPEQGLVESQSVEEYKKTETNIHSINHFYDKLLKLKDLLNTDSARRIAIHRDKFMRGYLDQFFDEWNLEDVDRILGGANNV